MKQEKTLFFVETHSENPVKAINLIVEVGDELFSDDNDPSICRIHHNGRYYFPTFKDAKKWAINWHKDNLDRARKYLTGAKKQRIAR